MLVILFAAILFGLILLVVWWSNRAQRAKKPKRGVAPDVRATDNADAPQGEAASTPIKPVVRHRMRFRRVAGIGLVFLCVVGIVGVAANWRRLRDHNWGAWKSLNSLLQDLEGAPGRRHDNALAELARRIVDDDTKNDDVDAILDRALAREADRSSTWDPSWALLIETAAKRKRLSKARAQRYLENAVTATMETRPKARRGQALPVHIEWKVDRLAAAPRLLASFSSTSLLLDSAVVVENFIPEKEPAFGITGAELLRNVTLSNKELDALPDGAHRLGTQLQVVMRQIAPFDTGKVTVNMPLSVRLELFPQDTVIDEFKAPAEQHDAELAAVNGARIIHDAKGDIEVRVKTGTLPVSWAMLVSLKQGESLYDLGALVVQNTQAPRWHVVRGPGLSKLSGAVDVILRPNQMAADTQQTLGSYWGETIIIQNQQVDAPYEVPFDRNEQLRAEVEKSMRVTIVRDAKSERLGVQADFLSPPAKLAYFCFLSLNGREVQVNEEGWEIAAKKESRRRGTCEDVDLTGSAMECDVIFRPNPDWERTSSDLAPPWGGEVVLHHVPIQNRAGAESKP